MSQDEAELTLQVNTMEEVLALIDTANAAYEKSEGKACINITRYLAGAKNL